MAKDNSNYTMDGRTVTPAKTLKQLQRRIAIIMAKLELSDDDRSDEERLTWAIDNILDAAGIDEDKLADTEEEITAAWENGSDINESENIPDDEAEGEVNEGKDCADGECGDKDGKECDESKDAAGDEAADGDADTGEKAPVKEADEGETWYVSIDPTFFHEEDSDLQQDMMNLLNDFSFDVKDNAEAEAAVKQFIQNCGLDGVAECYTGLYDDGTTILAKFNNQDAAWEFASVLWDDGYNSPEDWITDKV